MYKTFGQPEIIILGLDLDDMHKIINNIGEEVRKGQSLKIGEKYSQFLENHDAQFVEVDQKHYSDYLGWDLWFYEGSDFPAWQFVWPDKGNLFPWEEGFDKSLKNIETLLV